MAYIGNSPTSAGNYQIIDDISGSFNGSTTNFALAVGGVSISPGQTGQVIAAVNGIVQEPDDAGSAGFRIVNNTIVFAAAPTSGHAFWGVFQGSLLRGPVEFSYLDQRPRLVCPVPLASPLRCLHCWCQ